MNPKKRQWYVIAHGFRKHTGGFGVGMALHTLCGLVLHCHRPALTRDKKCKICARLTRRDYK